MSTYTSIVRQLDASRRLEEELAVEKHRQELQKQKIEQELNTLKESRKRFIDNQIKRSEEEYQKRLEENPDIAEEHRQRQLRAQKEKSKIAQADFEKERQRLTEERNNYDRYDKEYRAVEKALLDLQAKSKLANEQQDRRLNELELRRKLVTKLLDESKRRELAHFEKAKDLAL